jgi:hypothetical protein
VAVSAAPASGKAAAPMTAAPPVLVVVAKVARGSRRSDEVPVNAAASGSVASASAPAPTASTSTSTSTSITNGITTTPASPSASPSPSAGVDGDDDEADASEWAKDDTAITDEPLE